MEKKMADFMEDENMKFFCAICGLVAPQAVLCTKDACPTEMLVNLPPASWGRSLRRAADG